MTTTLADPDDAAMRERVLALLPPAERTWLAARLPVCPRRDRDEAVRAALALFLSPWRTAAARQLEKALDQYLARAWPIDRQQGGPPANDVCRRALYRLAIANDGKPLAWRRLYDLERIARIARN
jgi:hypothetical protein